MDFDGIQGIMLLCAYDKLIDWFREAIDKMIEEGEYMEMKKSGRQTKYLAISGN